jgi:hypothetical protein
LFHLKSLNDLLITLLLSEEVDVLVFPEYGITSTAMPADREKARPFFQIVPDVPNDVDASMSPTVEKEGHRHLDERDFVFTNPCDDFDPSDQDRVGISAGIVATFLGSIDYGCGDKK